jgi:dethiobiotin synthetase
VTPRRRIYFITGTDTGVGKTILTVALLRHLRTRGQGRAAVAGLKPFSSGDRSDARAIRAASGNVLELDEINPWHFRRALAPRVAAESAGRRITAQEVIRHVRAVARRFAITLVEGAGGVLSPLAVEADASSLIDSLKAIPILVCPNRLGAINQTLLGLRALTPDSVRRARVVLMQQARPDHSVPSNLRYLRRELGGSRVMEFPRVKNRPREGSAPFDMRTARVLDALMK